jgi:hypothetical protein
MPQPRLIALAALVLSGCLLAACTATAPLRSADLPEPGEVSPRRAQ